MSYISLLKKMWFEKIIDTYHREVKKFCMEEKDRFLNPIGSTYRESIGVIVDEIFGEFSYERIHSALENMVRIGCLHGYAYSKDASYTSLLRSLIDEYCEEGCEKETQQRIEKLYLHEAHTYKKVREKLEELKRENFTVRRYYRLK